MLTEERKNENLRRPGCRMKAEIQRPCTGIESICFNTSFESLRVSSCGTLGREPCAMPFDMNRSLVLRHSSWGRRWCRIAIDFASISYCIVPMGSNIWTIEVKDGNASKEESSFKQSRLSNSYFPFSLPCYLTISLTSDADFMNRCASVKYVPNFSASRISLSQSDSLFAIPESLK